MELQAFRPPPRALRWGLLTKLYLFLLVAGLHIDPFVPTQLILREAGSWVDIPLMLLGSLVILAARPQRFWVTLPASSLRVLLLFGGILLCGTAAFLVNLVCGWSRFGWAKDPVFQFIAQAALFGLTPLIVVTHAGLFGDRRWSAYVLEVIPAAAVLHLAAILFQATGLLDPNRLPLSLFRNPNATAGFNRRLAGLFSEPSTFAVMAALYALPLLLIPDKGHRWRNGLLATLLLGTALAIGAKTILPAAICGLAGYLWVTKARIFTLRNLAVGLLVAAISATVVVQQSALDVQENLSSAMRIGSTVTSLNAAFAGYGVLGVGFGQFHFFYQERFMPSFLFFSQEALGQMSSNVGEPRLFFIGRCAPS